MLKERKSRCGKRNAVEKIQFLNLAKKFYIMKECPHALCSVVVQKPSFYQHVHCLLKNLSEGTWQPWKELADLL